MVPAAVCRVRGWGGMGGKMGGEGGAVGSFKHAPSVADSGTAQTAAHPPPSTANIR